MTRTILRLQHLWAVLRRDPIRARELVELLAMLDTSALKANAASIVSTLQAVTAERDQLRQQLTDLTAARDAAAQTAQTDEAAAQADINEANDALVTAIRAAQPAG